MNESTQSIYATLLPFLGVLRLQGADAARFLQGQVTHDTALLLDGRTLLCACNTPQGRVIAVLRLRQADAAVYALLPTELLEPVAAHLRRFVLRARVDVQIAADLQVAWVGGQPLPDTRSTAGYDATRTVASLPLAGATEIVYFDYCADRQVIATPRAALRAIAGKSLPAIENAWWSADIAAGLPQVFRDSCAAFVPQMLNLDLLDAISFTKGCYTGQEIVARTQHLGRIKRRTFRYRLPAGPALAPLAGLTLDGAKVGEVVLSAARGEHAEALAVTSLEARGRTLRTEDGREAQPVALPYHIADSG